MEDTNAKRLKVGLLVDDPTCVSRYIHEFVQWANTQSDISLSHCIVHGRKVERRSLVVRIARILREKGIYRTLSIIAFQAISWIETWALRRSKAYHVHVSKHDISKSIPSLLVISPLVSKSGTVYRFSDSDVRKVRDLKLDILIRGGTGILRGEILNAARLGVLSFHHGDNTAYRGWPAGFWEVYDRNPKTGFVIQQLTEELDGGHVICRGWFPTSRTYMRNQANLFQKSNAQLFRTLKIITESGTLPKPEMQLPYSGPMRTIPTLAQSFSYAWKTLLLLALELAHRVTKRQLRWGVSYVTTNWRNAVFARSKQVPTPAGRFIADPFVIERDGATYCFVEDYVYAEGRGRISVFKIDKDGPGKLNVCLDEPFHLSFPYLFEFSGNLFMCPESSAARDIRVYKCVRFPLEWELHAVLMKDVAAVDTILFERGGIWWLLTSFDPQGSGDFSSELHLFYADEPFSAAWKPHPKNPLCVDCTVGRNGGLISEDSRLFRAAQKHGFGLYGESLSLFEITVLSTDAYAETLTTSISPDFRKRLLGCHHISTTGKVTVVDHVERARVN